MTQYDIDRMNYMAGGGVQDPYLVQRWEESRIKCQEAAVLKEIEVSSAKAKAEMLSDIAAQRELQKLKVEVAFGQKVKMIRERFGGELFDETIFSVIRWENFICLEEEKVKDKVLRLVIMDGNSRKKVIFYCYRKLEDRYINKKFNAAGIIFGFSHVKEMRVRKIFLAKLIETASDYFIPAHHGWYRENGEIRFAFPEDFTWEEVEPYV